MPLHPLCWPPAGLPQLDEQPLRLVLLRDMRQRGNVDRLPSAPWRGVPGPLGLGNAASVAVAVNRDRG